MKRRELLKAIVASPLMRIVPAATAYPLGYQVVHLTANTTLHFTPPRVAPMLLSITQDGGRSVTWPSNIAWQNGDHK